MSPSHSRIEILESRIAPAAIATLNLSSLNGTNGFKMSGEAPMDWSGYAVSDAGDVNGDGFDDVIIGARHADPNGGDSGASYVLFGKAGGFTTPLNLSTLGGSTGFKIQGEASTDRAGFSVSAAGDFNGDGFDDLVIGATGADPNGSESGAVYVVFGKAAFTTPLNLSDLNALTGFKIQGVVALDNTGSAVSTAGDVNGDGLDDLIIGARGASPNGKSSGASYVVFGQTTGFTAPFNLSSLNGANGFKLSGQSAYDYFGSSVSAAGDVNGDGFDDVIVGAPTYDRTSIPPGNSYVVFGKASGFSANLNVASLTGANGFRISGEAAGDNSGDSVSGAGDVNGDGFDDVIVGSSKADPNGNWSGASYVVFGKAAGFSAIVSLGVIDGTNGVKITGEGEMDTFGGSVSGAGDVNGDGFDDLIVGAYRADTNGTISGTSYVVFGKAGTFTSPLNAATLNGANGFKLFGERSGDVSGSAVSAAGDINGDGFDDVVIGAFLADPASMQEAGASYLVFGFDTGAVTHLGNASANTLTGDPSANVLIGGQAGDLIHGGAGADVLRGGEGSDVLGIGDLAFTRVEGGGGTDTLVLEGSSALSLNLTTLADSRLTGIERIDLSGLGAHTLTLDKHEVLALSGETNSLLVQRNANDVVNIGAGWTKGPATTISGVSYDVYTQGAATLRVQSFGEINLLSLDGLNGFRIDGAAANDASGFALSDAGDVNGDGLSDVIIGAFGAGPPYVSGAAYVVFGKVEGFGPSFSVAQLNGSNGFKLAGVGIGDYAGRSVQAAGDINGDGFGDVIVGAPSGDAAYVVFGKAGAFPATLNLSALNGANGFSISSGSFFDLLGASVSGAGDVNGDGFDDVIVGAPQNGDQIGQGAAYVIFGKSGGFSANFDPRTLNGANGFKISGTAARDYVGGRVSAAGDLNGDGFADLIVGARGDGGRNRTYLVFGKESGFDANLNVTALNGANGFTFSTGRGGRDAGDVNGDGIDDVIIGGYAAAYVLFGKKSAFTATVDSSSLNGATGFQIQNDGRHWPAVSGAGDVNGDGFDDLHVGLGFANYGTYGGASYVVFGKSTAFSQTLNLSTINGSNGFRLTGNVEDRAGNAVGGGGDINGDGFADVLVGASTADPNGSNSGSSYVVFGRGLGVRVGDATVLEGNSGTSALEFTVSLTEPSNVTVTVDLATADGTARAGSDYTALAPSTLTFAPGETRKMITVNALGDTRHEGDETFSVVLSNASIVISDAIGTGTIRNDDATPVVSIGNGSIVEGNLGSAALTLPVQLSAASELPVSVEFSTADGTARSASDYAPVVRRVVTFAPGETSKSATIDVTGDNVPEAHESFSLQLINPVNASLGNATGAATISNDDTVLRIFESTVTEGDSGTVTQNFNVSLSHPSVRPVSLDFATADGTALAGSDYTAVPQGRLTFAPEETSKTISVSILGDTLAEAHETFSVALANVVNATVGSATAFGTISNDDTVIQIADETIAEGDTGASALRFGVSLSHATVRPVSVNFATQNGTASAGADYVARSAATLSFAPGELSKTVEVMVNGETVPEAHENFTLRLSAAVNAGIGDDTATATIFNDDTTLQVADAAVAEGDSGTAPLAFAVSLSHATIRAVTVDVATGDGTALAGSDYAALSRATLSFAPGEMSKTVLVSALGDALHERDETFSLLLSSSTNAVLADAEAAGAILNDDAAPAVSIGSASLIEANSGTSGMDFTLSLSAASGLPVVVRYSAIGETATAGSDFVAPAPDAEVTFAPGETSKSISIGVKGDEEIEPHETLQIILSSATNATIASGTARGTIENDDTAIRISDSTALEGESAPTALSFTLSLEQPSALPVTVQLATFDGTATDGSDYVALERTFTFAPGETSQAVTVLANGDTEIEAHEDFTVVLTAPTNATIADAAGDGVILNDDTALRIGDATVIEGHTGTRMLTLTATLDRASALPVTVDFAASDGAATAGSDYTPLASGALSFAPGETSRTINVEVIGDSEVEADETFSVILSGATNAIIAEGTGTGTIRNDDAVIRIADASLLEGHSGTRDLVFAVSLSAASALPITVNFATVDGDASAGSDYLATAGALTFAPGETLRTIAVVVNGDGTTEPSETLTVLLSSAENAVVEDDAAVGTILNDDVTITGKRSATFTDVDGDLVAIKVSRGSLTAAHFTLVPSGLGAQLALVDFSGAAELADANLKIKANRVPGGDGFVNVGHIDGRGTDLGKVRVDGDLGQIDAGNGLPENLGLASLRAKSLGVSGLATQLPGGSLQSEIAGALGALKLSSDWRGATLLASGDLGAIRIKGDLLGGAVQTDGRIGSAKIRGDVTAATISAQGIFSPADATEALAIGFVSIGGSVQQARVLAGYDTTGAAANADAGVGRVTVGTDWIASDLVAGALAGADGNFGTDDDALIAGGNAIVAKIASIVIKGASSGTPGAADHFGFVAEEIAAFRSGGAKLPLMRGPSNNLRGLPVGFTGDLRARELPAIL